MEVNKLRGFEIVSTNLEALLPLRGSLTSAGYDFYATEDIDIKPQDKAKFATDVKVYMKPNEVFLMDIRSSKGIKDDLMIANTIGVIDSDYYNNTNNEGNIGICLRNLRPSMELEGYETILHRSGNNSPVQIPLIKDLKEENTIHIKKGERVVQGFFVEFKESDNCNSDKERNGGIGSSGK